MRMRISNLVLPMLGLPRAAKRVVVLTVDIGLCILTVWIAYYLRLDEFVAFGPCGQRIVAH